MQKTTASSSSPFMDGARLDNGGCGAEAPAGHEKNRRARAKAHAPAACNGRAARKAGEAFSRQGDRRVNMPPFMHGQRPFPWSLAIAASSLSGVFRHGAIWRALPVRENVPSPYSLYHKGFRSRKMQSGSFFTKAERALPPFPRYTPARRVPAAAGRSRRLREFSPR